MNGFGDILYISNNRSKIIFQTSLHLIYKHPLSEWPSKTKLISIYLPFIIVILLICGCWQSKHLVVCIALIPIYFQIIVQPKINLQNLSFLFFGQSNLRSNLKLFNGTNCDILYNSHPYYQQDIFSSIYDYTINFGNIDRLEYGDFIFIECNLKQKVPKNTSIVVPNYIKLADSYNAYKNWSIIIPFYWDRINSPIQYFMDQMIFNGTNLYKKKEIPKLITTKLLKKPKHAIKGFSYGIITLTRMFDTNIYSLAGGFNSFDESIVGAKCVLMNNFGNVDYHQFVGYLVRPLNDESKKFGTMCIRPNHLVYKTAYNKYIEPLLDAQATKK